MMKKLLIIFILSGIYSCKKEKDKPVEVATPLAPAPLITNAMTASVNGNSWMVSDNQTAAANISQSAYNGNPKQYVISGRTHPTLNKNSIYVGFAYTTGTVNLESLTNFYAAYTDSTGTAFPARTGTINIATIDTSHVKSSACDKFKATFSFVTSAIGGVSYTVTNGSIDFEAN